MGIFLGDRPVSVFFNGANASLPVQGVFLGPVQVFPAGAAAVSTALLLNFNGENNSTTFTDSSPNGFTVTAEGDAKISTAESKFGGASLFLDGDGDYLITEADPRLDLSANGDLTLEAWVYLTDRSTKRAICGSHASDSDGHTNVYVYDDGAVGVGRIGTNEIVTNAGLIAEDTWHHIAVVRHGAATTIYVDGVAEASASTAVWSSPETKTLRIGFEDPLNGGTWEGYIDDFRFTRSAVYTEAFTPPAAQLGVI
jgi:hypothetical protein